MRAGSRKTEETVTIASIATKASGLNPPTGSPDVKIWAARVPVWSGSMGYPKEITTGQL
ncbi:hypothetical protein FOQG_17925 [Fusarium oxysporum f. sp. raphani 54005]|uniref:Uncharacterized protein n=1 Tax=Fusarium oxysporum f. sp. raphani 54005 TaxID=1089458 RepID=X0B6H6_FUSOX|nr:hypothetical protein FOQG_17925 [Fusarium oxysporum f. sp. raphani 54005]